jgi:hypothetical protein
MSRLAEVSPAMRHRLGGLVEQYQSVTCDVCGSEFVARRGGAGQCPACGHLDQPATAAIVAAVGATIATSDRLDRHLDSTRVAWPFGKPVSGFPRHAPAAQESSMTTTRKVSGIARLLTGLHLLNDRAEKMADELDGHVARVTAGMAVTATVVEQVRQTADEIEAANALFTNGGESSSGEAASGTPGQG